jgi:2-keto-4-pentenoate hydratase
LNGGYTTCLWSLPAGAITLADTIADNASSGALALGEQQFALDGADLAGMPVTLTRNGEVVGERFGSAVLGDPIEGAVWLANMLGSLGQTLEAGSIIMSGSITAAVAIAPGDTVTASFGEFGSLTTEFVQ